MRLNTLIALMPNLPNSSEPPDAQGHGDKDTRETVPESGFVTCKQRLGALLIFVLRFMRDVGCNHGHKAKTDGFANLSCVSVLWVFCLMFLEL